MVLYIYVRLWLYACINVPECPTQMLNHIFNFMKVKLRRKKKYVNSLKHENGFKSPMWEDIFSVLYRGYYT